MKEITTSAELASNISLYAIPHLAMNGAVSAFRSNAAEKTDRIIETVLKFYNVTWVEIDRKTRKLDYMQPRQIIMYLLRIEAKMPLIKIATLFKQKFDHTTVIHAKNHIQNLIDCGELKRDISRIMNLVDNC
jgi:chromosomal replication initiation ATPase DnaA